MSVTLPVLLRQMTAIVESDACLMERYLQADEAAFAELVRRHGAMVLGVCRRTLGDRHTAEDACQATFLVLTRKVGTLRPGELAGWLHGVARRTALKARTTSSQPLPDLPSQARDPLAELAGRELLSILEDEIQRLPAAYRLPVTLCCVEGLTQEEVARRLNTTPGSVRGRVDRGRARLRARLTAKGLAPTVDLALAEFARGAIPSTTYTVASRVLAEEVLRSMFLTKIKVLVVTLLAAVCGAGAWAVQEGKAAAHLKNAAGSITATTPVATKPDTPDWGETDGGMQIRLRPHKAVWAAGELPSFEIDLRAAPGNREVGVAHYQHVDRVVIDGEEYELNPFTWKPERGGFRLGHLLEPGKDYGRVGTASLGEYRPVKGEVRPLKPGKHVIRMSALLLVPGAFAHPQSKPVEIEVLAAEKTPNALRGKWKVVKEERPDAGRTRWIERPIGATDSFTFTAGTVVWDGENSYGSYTVLLDEEKKTLEMRSLIIAGIADAQVGRYKLDGDDLILCFGKDRELPANFTPQIPAARLYRLERVESKLHGEWTSEQDCVGDLTIRADGTFGRTRYGPGSASLKGTWSMRWDTLPPTLILTCKTSIDKDYVGQVWEMKVTRLDADALVCKLSENAVSTFTRVKAKPDAHANTERLIP